MVSVDLPILASAVGPLRAAYASVLALMRVDRALIRELHARGHTLVLNLHRVSPQESPYWPPLRPELFDELVGFLKRNFDVVTLADLALVDPKRAAVVLSFDDGYRDFLDHAAPILAAHGVRANMNVIPECVESGAPIWNVRLYDGLATASATQFKELRVTGFSFPAGDASARGKARFGARLAAYLKNRPAEERRSLWREVEEWLSRVGIQPTPMMRVDDVRSIAETHEVGAHSYSHESMAFESEEFFREDVRKCGAFFADHLRLPLLTYAFPNGSYRPSQVEHLVSMGFEHVLLVDEKVSTHRGRVLPRLSINAPTLAELKLQALGHRAQGIA